MTLLTSLTLMDEFPMPAKIDFETKNIVICDTNVTVYAFKKTLEIPIAETSISLTGVGLSEAAAKSDFIQKCVQVERMLQAWRSF